MFPPEVILNYNQTIAGVTNIITSPTGLESTSVVLGKKHALKNMTSLFEILAAFALCDFHKNTFFAISIMAKNQFLHQKKV